MKSKVALLVGDRDVRVETLPVPEHLGPGEALLRVDGNGVCRSDHEQYTGELRRSGISGYPVVPGHEPVGTVEWLGEDAASAYDVSVGDRVAVEAFVACGVCRPCMLGRRKHCVRRFLYGYTLSDVGCGLWGGFSEYLVLRPGTLLHRIDPSVDIRDAALFNALGAGFAWVQRAETGVGDSVLIMGPGQRGLGSVIAAAEAGAACIIVTGLARDRFKLDLARRLGAHHVIDVSEENVVDRVREITGGAMVDQVVDTTPMATGTVADAVACVRAGGTVVLAGIKGRHPATNFYSDDIVLKDVVMKGVLSVDSWAFEQALRAIGSGRYPLMEMHTHVLSLEEVERGFQLIGGEIAHEEVLHITVVP